jgi:hypothetical protein
MLQIISLDFILILVKVLVFVKKVEVGPFVNIFQKPVADIVANQSFLDVLSHIMLFPSLL